MAKHHRQRLLEMRVRGELVQMEITPITDPVKAYGDLAGEVWAFKELLREQLQTLQEWETYDAKNTENIRAVIAEYGKALDRVQKTLADMLRIGLTHEAIQAARARPSREQAEALGNVITTLLNELGLTDEQRERVPAALSVALRKEGLQ